MASDSSKRVLEEMLMAVQANINYLRTEGSDTLKVKNGELVTNLGEIFIYKFELEYLQDIETDADIEIRFNNHNSSGKVIAIDEKSIQIQTETFLGATIAEAKVIISSYYLLELLHKKLKEVLDGEKKLTSLSEKTFGLEASHTARIDTLSSQEKEALDKYKRNALQLIFGSEVSFIWGPPGTGKTELIASVIKKFVGENKSTLLISHTNIATDGALERSVRDLKDTKEYQEGKILRIGKIQKDSLKENELVIPEKVVEKLQLPISKEIERLNIDITLLKKEIEIADKYQSLSFKHEELEKSSLTDSATLNLLNEENEVHISNASKCKSELNELESEIVNFQSMNSFRRLFTGTNLQQLTSKKVALLGKAQSIEDDLTILKAKIDKCKDKINKSNEEKKELQVTIQSLKQELQNKNVDLNQNRSEISKLTEQRDALVEQLDKLSLEIINKALVIATTLTKSYSDKSVLSRTYDCVILDEASMAPLPAVWYATGLATQKAIMVGDFFQLPPIAKHKVLKDKNKTEAEYEKEESLVQKWLKEDIFNVAGIFTAIKNNQTPEWLEQLRLQYRMHPDIADLINHIMYRKYGEQYQLESADNTKSKGLKLLSHSPSANSHIGIYDTSAIGTIASRTDSGSYYNLYHALLVVELAKQAIGNGYEEIGIISPFRAQINLIQKIVKDEQLTNNIEADTVHRFQGGEKQIVIFDITTPKPTKLTDDEVDGGDDEKLVNVAFSRAKEKCIVVSDIEELRKKHSPSSPLRKFVDYCIDKKYPILSSEDILNNFSYTEKSEEWLEKINHVEAKANLDNFKPYDQTDFYQNFIKDLLSAEKEVIIESPFLTSKRVSMFMPIFDFLIKKGVKIFILTRPPKEHKDNMKIEAETEFSAFEDIGVTVLPLFGRIHEKVGIIDRNILWAGSLNILSQNVSKEIMWRFEGRSVADQIISFLKLKKNIGELGENNLKRCEICKTAGAWYWTDKSRYGGIWTFCLIGMHKPGKEPLSKAEKDAKKAEQDKWNKMKKEYTKDGIPICPKHEIPMVKRKGHWGPFWSCSKFPHCRIKEKLVENDKNQVTIDF